MRFGGRQLKTRYLLGDGSGAWPPQPFFLQVDSTREELWLRDTVGGYEGLSAAWGEFDAWITSRGGARRARTSGRTTSPARSRTPTQPPGARSSTGR